MEGPAALSMKSVIEAALEDAQRLRLAVSRIEGLVSAGSLHEAEALEIMRHSVRTIQMSLLVLAASHTRRPPDGSMQ
jgi:hypothetical protein